MRQSLLGHLVPLIRQPEPAATQALHYILEAAPEAASAFVELLVGGRFEIGRIASEWQFGNGVRPDLAIYDAHGELRLFVENKFWAPLTDQQPVEYLTQLPAEERSTLAFIAPEDRAVSLWGELKDRCDAAKLHVADERSSSDFRRMRVGERTLLLTSWRFVLDRLQRAAASSGHAAVAEDVVQLQGLTEQMNSGVFSPLSGDEPTDVRVARRMLNYGGLIDDISERLIAEGVADTKGLTRSGWGRFLRLHGRFGLWLGVDLGAWGRWGITPIWSEHNTASSFSGVKGEIGQVAKLFDDVQEEGDLLGIPIRLETGVERARVVDGGVRQMRRIAEGLVGAFPADSCGQTIAGAAGRLGSSETSAGRTRGGKAFCEGGRRRVR